MQMVNLVSMKKYSKIFLRLNLNPEKKISGSMIYFQNIKLRTLNHSGNKLKDIVVVRRLSKKLTMVKF